MYQISHICRIYGLHKIFLWNGIFLVRNLRTYCQLKELRFQFYKNVCYLLQAVVNEP